MRHLVDTTLTTVDPLIQSGFVILFISGTNYSTFCQVWTFDFKSNDLMWISRCISSKWTSPKNDFCFSPNDFYGLWISFLMIMKEIIIYIKAWFSAKSAANCNRYETKQWFCSLLFHSHSNIFNNWDMNIQ